VAVTGFTALVASSKYTDVYQLTGFYLGILGLFSALGAVLATHNSIIGEKHTGTVEWVLSKPVSRTAFVLAKVITSAVGMLVLVILVQGLFGYLLISISRDTWLDVPRFMIGLGVVSVYLFLYVSLTILLGTLFDSRPLVIGTPIFLLVVQIFMVIRYRWAGNYLPGALIIAAGEKDSYAARLVLGQPGGSTWPLAISALLILAFTLLAMWRFSRQQF
jgi:ABC-2 type transport system permease protein